MDLREIRSAVDAITEQVVEAVPALPVRLTVEYTSDTSSTITLVDGSGAELDPTLLPFGATMAVNRLRRGMRDGSGETWTWFRLAIDAAGGASAEYDYAPFRTGEELTADFDRRHGIG